MDTKLLSSTIAYLETIQMDLQAQRRDHNGNVINHDDIDQIQITIDIIKNLIIEPSYIWHK